MKDLRRRDRSFARTLGVVALLLLLATALLPARRSVATAGASHSGAGLNGAILPIRGTITDVTVDSLKRRIAAARAAGAKVVVFELDTPGGLVMSSIAISDLIKQMTDVKTVAWVNPNAISGGAMVAIACEEIVMSRSSRMGDSQVIMGGPEGVQAVPEDLQPKAYTPVIAEFKASATLRGYSTVLAEAFVVPQREVWWLENRETGQREFVFRDEKIRRMGDDDAAETLATPADRPWKLVETYFDVLTQREERITQPIERADELLQMSASLAQAYGFSKAVVSNEAELRSHYGMASVIRLDPVWSEDLVDWLTSPIVRGVLLMIVMLGAYVEAHTPGLGLAGLAALLALAVFLGAPYLTGLANVWEVLFVVVGIMLILVELFVIPGFGVAGIAGLALVLIGLLASFAPAEPGRSFPLYIPSMHATLEGLKRGVTIVVSSSLVSLVGMVILSRYLPHIPVFRRMIPANPTPSEVLVDDPYLGGARVGDIGQAAGPLRPAGKAYFGTLLVDVVTEGEFIEPQTLVEVVERRGNRVVVRPMTQS